MEDSLEKLGLDLELECIRGDHQENKWDIALFLHNKGNTSFIREEHCIIKLSGRSPETYLPYTYKGLKKIAIDPDESFQLINWVVRGSDELLTASFSLNGFKPLKKEVELSILLKARFKSY